MGKGYASVVEDIDPEVWRKLPSWAKEVLEKHRRVRGVDVDDELRREVDRLSRLLGLIEELKVKWIPGGRAGVSGEVVGSTVYLYSKDLSGALETLKHEVIEYFLVKHHEEDYITMINALVEVFNRVMRRRREDVVDRLSKII